MLLSPQIKSRLLKVFFFILLVKLVFVLVSYLPDLVHNTNARVYMKSTNVQHEIEDATNRNVFSYKPTKLKQMVLVTVSCGDRLNETNNVIKSAAALSRNNLLIIIFTEKQHMNYYSLMVTQWPNSINERVKVVVKEAVYPANVDEKKWRPLFRPCSSLRLFMPTLLQYMDAIIYVDIDILFMTPVDHYWNYFSAMNSSQMAALVPEHMDMSTGWYNRFATHPYYGKLGLNSGIMLMNLTRFRTFSWDEYPDQILLHFQKDLKWGDQDIINIIFHYHPDKVYVMGCENNYRPEFCMHNVNVCKAADEVGIQAVHGSRLAFTGSKFPAFKAVHKAWNSYRIGDDLRQNLYYPMQSYLLEASRTYCGKLYVTFLLSLKELADPV